MKEATITIENLTIGYRTRKGDRVVARKLDGTIWSGELTCLLGVNGVGKSTLMRTLSAFQYPLSGTIRLAGRPLEDYDDAALAHTIGIVLTEKPDVRNMTVTELVGMGRSPYTGFWGTLDAVDRRVVAESLELVGIASLADRMIQTLSDGERQKMMVAKALAQQTPVIFLDEPTAFLDYPSKVEVMQLLQRLSREMNKTIFLSTHDLELALQIADRLWLMKGAEGVEIGTPEDLSLSGAMGRFFAHRGVAFDVEAGLFRVKNDVTAKVGVSGEGAARALLEKALRRNGIGVASEDNAAALHIVVEGPNTFRLLRDKADPLQLDSIGAVLDAI